MNIRDDIFVDDSGIKWFLATEFFEGFAGGGLMSFDGENWTYHRDDFWLAYAAKCLAVDQDNVKWIGTHSGIARYDGGHDDVSTEVGDTVEIPETLKIITNFPNPFNPSTTIQFTMPKSGTVSMTIYSSTGQKVREIVSGFRSVGTQTVSWDGKDDAGMSVSSGLYFARLVSNNHTATARMLLLK